jgi:hypothetical protein
VHTKLEQIGPEIERKKLKSGTNNIDSFCQNGVKLDNKLRKVQHILPKKATNF